MSDELGGTGGHLVHPLLPKLKQLHLGGMLGTLEVRAAQAVGDGLSPTEFLALLLDDELEVRPTTQAKQAMMDGCRNWLGVAEQ